MNSGDNIKEPFTIHHSPFTEFAHALADAAGAAIRPYFGAHGDVTTKIDDSPVTQADRAAEQAMRALIAERFPEHGIYGEEFGVQDSGFGIRDSGQKKKATASTTVFPESRIPNPESTYTWVLDPIDGTRAFIAGKKEWGTLIALCENGIPILGILDQPVTGERWVGVKGEMTQYSVIPAQAGLAREAISISEPIQSKEISMPQTRHVLDWLRYANRLSSESRLRGNDALSTATLSTTSRRYFTPARARAYENLAAQCKEVIEDGDCYAYGLLANGQRDIVVDAGLKPYDILALVPIIEGAGGVITAWDGSAITLTNFSTALAARTLALHQMGKEILHRSVAL